MQIIRKQLTRYYFMNKLQATSYKGKKVASYMERVWLSIYDGTHSMHSMLTGVVECIWYHVIVHVHA